MNTVVDEINKKLDIIVFASGELKMYDTSITENGVDRTWNKLDSYSGSITGINGKATIIFIDEFNVEQKRVSVGGGIVKIENKQIKRITFDATLYPVDIPCKVKIISKLYGQSFSELTLYFVSEAYLLPIETTV